MDRYFKNESGDISIYNELQDVPEGMIELTLQELGEYLNPSPTYEEVANMIRLERDYKIEQILWRKERYYDELALELEPTEDVIPILLYIQALRDIPQQAGFPEDITWPEVP